MAKIYLGQNTLVDLTGYATESYVDTAVQNVDVTEQLDSYALKETVDASIVAIDASVKNADASIAAIKSTLAEITGEGAEADTVINTWNEMKQFVADYSTANDLSTLIAAVAADASADAAAKYQPLGSYVVPNDISTFITGNDIANFVSASDIAATYETKNDASAHVNGAGITNIVKLTAQEYAALETKSATTLYIVSD